MRKRLAAVAIVGTLGLAGVGAAVAVPALADTSSSSSDGRVSWLREKLQGLVDDKTITDAQADKVAEKLAADGPGRGGFGGPGGPGRGGFGGPESLDAAAKVLGLSTDELRTALRDGSTLADLAKKQGKSTDDVVSALVTAAKARLAEAVKAGRLTQAQADERAADLQTRIKDLVENGRPARGDGDHDRDGDGPSSTPSTQPSTQPSANASGASFAA